MVTPTSGRKKTWQKLAIPATLVAGITAGAFFSPIGIASAADDTATEERAEGATQEERSENRAERKAERKAERAERKAERAEAIAGVLGITADELKAGFEDGKTLADQAEENDVERADLVAALTELAEARVDEALAEGKIDDEKAAEIRDNLAEKIEEKVDRTPGEGKGDRGGHRKGRFGHGMKDKIAEGESSDSA